MLDWKTAALMFSWLMLVGLDKGILRAEEVKEVGLSSWQLAPDCWLACTLLGLPRRWFEYFIGTSLTVLSVH